MKLCNQLMHPLVVVRSHGEQSDVSIKIFSRIKIYSDIKMQPDTFFFHTSSEYTLYQHASLGIHVHCKLAIKFNNLNMLDHRPNVLWTLGSFSEKLK